VAAIASSRDRGLDPFLIAPETINAGEVDCAKNELFLDLIFADSPLNSMFMRVNSKCAHQVRPPFGLLGAGRGLGHSFGSGR
jgi:hypothetical protein